MKKAILVLLVGYAFGTLETAYFINKHGWHYWPINNEERICDAIMCIVMAYGCYLFIKAILKRLSLI